MIKIRFWLPAVLWMLLIFTFSSFPVAKTTTIFWQDFFVKKSAHVVEYAVLTVFLYRGLLNTTYMNKSEAGFYSILIAVLYAFSDEFHQGFTSGREPTIRDIVFDTIGSLSAIFFLWKLLPKMPMKLKNLAKNFHLH